MYAFLYNNIKWLYQPKHSPIVFRRFAPAETLAQYCSIELGPSVLVMGPMNDFCIGRPAKSHGISVSLQKWCMISRSRDNLTQSH